jgi:SNF2 family DNA or RNA helicase
LAQIKIDKKGRRIELRSTAPISGLVTAVPGAYKRVDGVWTVPLSLESCKLLRAKYGRRLEMGSELRRWAQGVVNSRAYMAKLAASADAELTVLSKDAPAIAQAMKKRKYQRVGVRFIADSTAILLADDPGLGKTITALGGIIEAGIEGPYLIVAPKTAADSVWRREILRWLPKGHRPIIMPEFSYARERKLRLTRYGPKTWVILHPEMVRAQSWLVCQEKKTIRKRQVNKRTGRKRVLRINTICGERTAERARQKRELSCGHFKKPNTKKEFDPKHPILFEKEWGAIIVDESHDSLIKRGSVPTQRRRGLDKLKLRPDGIRIAMSGTPFDSKPHQLWGTLNWLDSSNYSAFNRWAELYWQKTGYTGYEIGEFRVDREELLWDSLSSVALRRTKAEVAQDLPPKIEVGTPLDPLDESSPVGIWLEMDGKQAKAYESMEKLSVAELESGRLEAISALAELTRLKQLACSYGDIVPVMRKGEVDHKYIPQLPSNKFDWIVENLEEWGYPKNPITKVVIVSMYTGILEAFQRGLEAHFKTKKTLCTAITGKTPGQDRRSIIDRFNRSGTEQIMMLNVKAGGTAITIDSADRMIFISETRSPDQQKQAEDRIHRVSNPRQCMYYYLRSLGTVDVGTALINQEAISDTHRLLDGRRGVEYMRHVMDLSKDTR